ncbi:tetratricopeptide repeat protein [Vampirovibrio sp.]|uniref:CAF17-like 4Fe-4S cluster assembly/insertion protein YgfZ n=1 Tax=Vampirovibrio sp. TaxID=2717857 RepID=UPI003593622A
MSAPSCAHQPETLVAVQTVRKHFGFCKLTHYALIMVSGPDASSFLQNRLSNDILALSSGQGHQNTVLDRQGKIQGVFDLYRADEQWFMLIDAAERDNALGQIEKFHILEQFQTQDTAADFEIWTLQGPASAEVLKAHLPQEAELPAQLFDWKTLELFGIATRVIRRSLSGEDGFVLLVPTAQAEAFQAALVPHCQAQNGVEFCDETLEILRIEAGLPRFGKDYTFETLLPETGLERVAVSYSKGCYLGQETIARVKTYGMVQQALVGLLLPPESVLPPEGAPCQLDGKTVGHITSATYSPTLKRPAAMVYLGKNERIPGKILPLVINGIQYQAEVALLPFYTGLSLAKSGEALLQDGLKLFSEGYEEEAIRYLREAVAAAPDLLAAYEALGVILSRHGQYDEAIEMMNRVLALDANHVLAHTNLSVFYMKLGDKEKAEDEKAKATLAAFSQKAKAAGLTFDIEAERRKKEQATQEKIAMFQEALKFSPEDPLGNFGLGSSFLELKHYEAAIEPFEKTLKAQPKHSVAYLMLSKSLEGAGQLDQAKATLQKGIEVAAAKGDLMPLKEMQARLENLSR